MDCLNHDLSDLEGAWQYEVAEYKKAVEKISVQDAKIWKLTTETMYALILCIY
jgi:hypothetical protein